jgi:TfoX/Sxy family transcriptional regulator of competence genes
MATMPKAGEADREFFRSLVPDDPRVEVKPMFGSLGAFVNGRMFFGLIGSDVGVKLDDASREELLAEDGAGPFGPAERPMGRYAALPPAWRASPERARPWVERALAEVGALPPKEPKEPKPRAKKPG